MIRHETAVIGRLYKAVIGRHETAAIGRLYKTVIRRQETAVIGSFEATADQALRLMQLRS